MTAQERRQIGVAGAQDLDDAMKLAWAKLPPDCQWVEDRAHA